MIIEEGLPAMYLVITLADEDTEIVHSLWFDSMESAATVLADLRNGSEEIVTLESDTSDSLTIRRSAIANSHLSSVAPPQRERAMLVSSDELIKRLGRPMYDGQNTFGFIIGQPPYTITVSNRRDRVIVWECGGIRPNRCMAECYGETECRYWPCAIHQADTLSG